VSDIDQLLSRLKFSPGDLSATIALAEAAAASQQEERALRFVSGLAAKRKTDKLLWQWTGLLHRALDQHGEALKAFDAAAQLAPGDVRIAQGRAQTALEAGLDAVELFDKAIALEPNNGEMLLSRAAARVAAGDSARAIAEIETLLGQHPGWYPGHDRLIQLRWMMGERERATELLDRAADANPGDLTLWRILILAHIEAGQWDKALDAIRRGKAVLNEQLTFTITEATVHSETGAVAEADRLFKILAGVQDLSVATRHIRHLLRNRRIEAALPLIDQWLAPAGPQRGIWPYAAIAWQLAGDPRAAWLEGDPALVSVIDLADRGLDLERLAAVLRGMHRAKSEHLDQSVRGGTQTDGPLFSRIEPEIQALRALVVAAAADHAARLPARDPGHPLLAPRRPARPRFAGSWSVRLSGQGYHANHVHPAGWISSAFYVALPPETGGEAGWLTLGSPQAELGLDLPPARTIEPRPGRLVLFPSTMWHGTKPYPSGERLTVAFDIALPTD
jgi:tetratricopeptide (TPR) repeat protein